MRQISAAWMATIMGIIAVSLILMVTVPILIPALGVVLALLIICTGQDTDWLNRVADNLLKP